MTLFENILYEMRLLTEDASVNDINSAISGLHPVYIKYDDGENGGGKNKRLIYPVAYGISTAGNPVIRAFQAQGSSKSGAPKWKLFRLDRINFWRTVGSRQYNPQDLNGFNQDGDAQIETLYTIAPIGNAQKIQSLNNQNGIKPTPITKQDIEKAGITNIPQVEPSDNRSADDEINSILTNINGGENVDNKPSSDYHINVSQNADNGNEIEAPETEPVTKNQIQGDNVTNTNNEPQNQESPEVEQPDEPITKDDLETKEDVKSKFNDMMNRINKVENNDEEI